MNNAVIIGYGVVGYATAKVFGIESHYDIDSTRSNIDFKKCSEFKYIFICLPTPTVEGKCYTKDIYETIKNLITNNLSKDSIIVIRSTVYPGFNRFLQKSFGLKRIVSNPEFLSEKTAIEDMLHSDMIIIGGENQDANSQIFALYRGRFKYVEPIVTDSITAELIKYSLNSFFVTKVVFSNAIYEIAQELQANYETIKKVLTLHKWGSKNHFEVFHKQGKGAGGRCLPKDLEVLKNISNGSFFDMIWEENDYLLKESGKK